MTDREINEAVARGLGHNPSGAFINAPNGRHEIWVSGDGRTSRLPDYCRDIKEALEVVEWLRSQDFNTKKMFVAHLTYEMPPATEGAEASPLWWFMFSAEWQKVICRAFLKLKENTELSK